MDGPPGTPHGPKGHASSAYAGQPTPATPDEIAQILLEEMIVSDPEWIQTCAPARAKLWELASASAQAREVFTRALREARITPARFWEALAQECTGAQHE